MKPEKYYLFVLSGIASLIITFFIEIVTAIGIIKEYQVISDFNWLGSGYIRWFELTYIITYYLIRITMILALLIPPKRLLIMMTLIFFILNLIGGIFIFLNDFQPLWITYIPYLLTTSMWIIWGFFITDSQHNEKSLDDDLP